jgi:hypothetical protein
MGTGGPFPGGKARPGRDDDHSPPSSAEVVNEYELYLLSSQAPSWRVEGLLYFTYLLTCLCQGSNPDLPVVQSVARQYTDWATPAPVLKQYVPEIRLVFW